MSLRSYPSGPVKEKKKKREKSQQLIAILRRASSPSFRSRASRSPHAPNSVNYAKLARSRPRRSMRSWRNCWRAAVVLAHDRCLARRPRRHRSEGHLFDLLPMASRRQPVQSLIRRPVRPGHRNCRDMLVTRGHRRMAVLQKQRTSLDRELPARHPVEVRVMCPKSM